MAYDQPAGQISVSLSGLIVVTHPTVQGALADLDAGIVALNATSWQSLTLGTNISASAGLNTPAARLEANNVVRLRGELTAGAAITFGAVIAILPNALMSPAHTIAALGSTSGIYRIAVASGALNITASASIANAATLTLDGVTFTTD